MHSSLRTCFTKSSLDLGLSKSFAETLCFSKDRSDMRNTHFVLKNILELSLIEKMDLCSYFILDEGKSIKFRGLKNSVSCSRLGLRPGLDLRM